MDRSLLARSGAIVFVAVAITATAIGMAHKEVVPAATKVVLLQSAPEQSSDPLRKEQRRCQQIGQQAVNDAGCLQVWAITRDRFLGRPSDPAGPAVQTGAGNSTESLGSSLNPAGVAGAEYYDGR